MIVMFERKTTGSVICRSCGRLVGVNDDVCFNCGARNPGLWGYAPLLRKLGYNLGFVQIITWGCVALYVVTLLFDPAGIRTGGAFAFLAPSTESLLIFGASGSIPVFMLGRWWTLLSAGWLHGGLLHIFFNLLWVRQLAPVTASLYGSSRLVIIYTVATITGFTFSTLAGVGITIGASAPLFGLFGALFWAGRKTGSSEVGQQALMYAIILLIFGFLWPNVDNFAHIGGFVGGVLAAVWLNPLKEENYSHLLLALVCVAATAISIVMSVLFAFI